MLLLQFLNENQKSQKYFLGGIEQVVALHAKTLVPKVPVILKTIYDLDLVEEEVLLAWAAKVTSSSSLPFLSLAHSALDHIKMHSDTIIRDKVF